MAKGGPCSVCPSAATQPSLGQSACLGAPVALCTPRLGPAGSRPLATSGAGAAVSSEASGTRRRDPKAVGNFAPVGWQGFLTAKFCLPESRTRFDRPSCLLFIKIVV